MESLQELTGQESGIIIYGDSGEGDSKEAIVCNWAHVNGYPRVFATGLIGLGEEIPEVDGEHMDDLSQFMDTEIIYNVNNDEWPTSGTVYRVEDDITVIAPDGWA